MTNEFQQSSCLDRYFIKIDTYLFFFIGYISMNKNFEPQIWVLKISCLRAHPNINTFPKISKGVEQKDFAIKNVDEDERQ